MTMMIMNRFYMLLIILLIIISNVVVLIFLLQKSCTQFIKHKVLPKVFSRFLLPASLSACSWWE